MRLNERVAQKKASTELTIEANGEIKAINAAQFHLSTTGARRGGAPSCYIEYGDVDLIFNMAVTHTSYASIAWLVDG